MSNHPRNAAPSTSFPAAIPKGLLYSFKREGLITGREIAAMHGMDMGDKVFNQEPFFQTYADIFNGLKFRNQIKFLGGSLDTTLMACWMVYVLCNLRRIPETTPQHTIALNNVDDDAGEGEDDAPE